MDKATFQALWHTLAVGMFYRAQSEENPATYYHWEQQSLSVKLHWQAKAKLALKELAP